MKRLVRVTRYLTVFTIIVIMGLFIMAMAQQLAWQIQNPGQTNPYTNMNVDVHDKQIGLKVTMDHSALALANGVAPPQN